LIQCACRTDLRDAALVELKKNLNGAIDQLGGNLDEETAQLDHQFVVDSESVRTDTATSLASLRHKLLILGLLTVGLAVAGTFFFVYLGLSPLSRLSEAVSKVSEKDFRLQMDSKPMPKELLPIADRLSQTLDLLKRAFAREKQATADISHELRTPLAALMTTIDVTLRKTRSSEEYRDALQDCKESAQQMNHAVERLLALARLDAGVDAVRRESVDVASLARQCVSVVRPLAEANGLAVHVEADPTAPASTDPGKVREILSNLLHNAIEYNRPQGSIDVRVRRENGHIRLEVADTGIGIPETARPYIFERFYRADPSRQSDGMHTGLGLSIVKGYVDLMGGSIQVESEEGKGSTFRVQLPA